MNNDEFIRIKEIAENVIPYEINLMTNREGWEDTIDMRGKNLKLSLNEEDSRVTSQIRLSDERGLTVTIPFEGVEIINEYKGADGLIIEIYFFIYEGFARITLKGQELIVQNTDKDIEFNKIVIQAKSCFQCEAMQDTEAVIGYKNGSLDADIMFIAEAPGPRGADKTGIPLHGDVTGNNFEKLLDSTRWIRSDIFITNAVLCCPTDENGRVRTPIRQEVKNCRSYLERIIDLVNPKVVVPLGQKALEALKEIEHHQLILKQDVATYTEWNGRFIYPLYHPSPQVINTKIRTMQQQRTDFKQLEHNYKNRISLGKEPINYQRKESEE